MGQRGNHERYSTPDFHDAGICHLHMLNTGAENHLLVTLMLFLRDGILVGHHLMDFLLQRLLQSACQEEILHRLLQLARNPRSVCDLQTYQRRPVSSFPSAGRVMGYRASCFGVPMVIGAPDIPNLRPYLITAEIFLRGPA
jgi:hypothetical protein